MWYFSHPRFSVCKWCRHCLERRVGLTGGNLYFFVTRVPKAQLCSCDFWLPSLRWYLFLRPGQGLFFRFCSGFASFPSRALGSPWPTFGRCWKAWRSGLRMTEPRWTQTCSPPWPPGHCVFTEGAHQPQKSWTRAFSCVMRTRSRKIAARKPFGVSAVFTYSEHEVGRKPVFPSDLNTHL